MDRFQLEPIYSKNFADKFETFWQKFTLLSDNFYQIIKSNERVEEDFFEILTIMLDDIYDGIFFLAGIENGGIAELIFTPIGSPKNVLLVEELVASAPKLKSWNFHALKPANPNLDFDIKFDNLIFTKQNIKFYPILHPQYPDEIDLMFVYDNFHEEVYDEIFNGIFLFLENYLGEEFMLESIDNFQIESPKEANQELIPINKLKDYLIWRKKEFVEKYHQLKYTSESHNFITFDSIVNGNVPVVSFVNKDLIHWEYKASHPWILSIVLKMIKDTDLIDANKLEKELISKIQKELDEMLPENKGYIFIGSHRIDGNYEIFFACQEYRRPSAALREIEFNYAADFKLRYDIFKDKYWRIFEWYANSEMFS